MSLLIITSSFNRPDGVRNTVESVITAFGGRNDYLHVVVNDGGPSIRSGLQPFLSQKLILIENLKNKGKNSNVHDIIIKYGGDFNFALSLDDDDILCGTICEIDFTDVTYATIATPKRLSRKGTTAPQEIFSGAVFEFSSALQLVAVRPDPEICFALNSKLYARLSLNLHRFISQRGPELCIYDVVSRGLTRNRFIDTPLMTCEYQPEGMTATFRQRLKNRPQDFFQHYKYMTVNAKSPLMRFAYAFRLVQVLFFAALNKVSK